MKQIIVGSSLFLLATCAAFGQSGPLTFDAASVKTAPRGPDDRVMRMMGGGPGTSNPGSFNFQNVTLKMLIMRAYNLKEYQVEGPDWIRDGGYDVVAKIPAGSTREQANEMLQNLLKERFGLVSHREQKQLPVFALMVAKGGPKMKQIENPVVPEVPPPGGRGPQADPLAGGRPPALGRMPSGPGIRLMVTPQGQQMAGQMTMAQLANTLTNQVGRAVLDETELNGTFDVDITWMPDEMSGGGRVFGGPGPGNPGPDGPRTANDPTMTLPQALQEKLGLKLEPKKSMAEVLVVDKVNQVPVEN